MFKRYGVFVLALGLIWSAQVFAQSPDQTVDQEAEGDRQEQGQSSTAPPGFPIRILEDPEQAERRERQQGETAQREIDDLVAQQRAAKAAEGAYKIGVAQTILAFFGTIALLYSLWLNRRATNAAVEAVTVTRETGQAQVRAYLHFDMTKVAIKQVTDDARGNTMVAIEGLIVNTGQSPARETEFCYNISVVGPDELVEVWGDGRDLHKTGVSSSAIAANGDVNQGAKRTFEADWHKLAKKEQFIRFSYIIFYTDVFDIRQPTARVSGIFYQSETGEHIFLSDKTGPVPKEP